MALTLAEKIIQNHIVRDACSDTDFTKNTPIKTGSHIAIKIDQTLTQDATGTMAYLQFELIDIPRVKTELSVSYVDHNTLQTDFKNMDDHRYLQSIAAKYGLWFSRPGNGICHQVHLEKFAIPGKTLLGSDSHTPTSGGLGMIAIGSGGLDVAVAMGGGAFHLAMPKIIGVHLKGKLKAGVGAKDIILEVLRQETVKGGVNAIYEYFGDGVESLSVPQRSTITNMGAELGATCSIFPSDSRTKEYLHAMEREESYIPLAADEGAEYYKTLTINLDTLDPLAACPHSPGEIKSISELQDKEVHQVAIGSCTNSSLDDLYAVAAIVDGKHIAPGVEAGIAPGSRRSLILAEKAGILGIFIRAGFRILESACGPCIGQGFAPSSGGVSLRTFNRNFKGRSGTPDAEVYLVSPETAAVAAITGKITNPLVTFKATTSYSNVSILSGKTKILSLNEIKQASKDDGMFIPPLTSEDSLKVEIIRGPNIKPCPKSPLLENNFTLPVILKAGDNISTDEILPAGSKMLPLRSNIPEIAKYTLERVDTEFYTNAMNAKKNQGGSIIVGGENYGQGSSREHAALAPMYLGVRIVLVKSFARIHKANLINYGIVPITFKNPNDYDLIEKNAIITIPNIKKAIQENTDFIIEVNNKQIIGKNDLDVRSSAVLLAGGLLAFTKQGGQ